MKPNQTKHVNKPELQSTARVVYVKPKMNMKWSRQEMFLCPPFSCKYFSAFVYFDTKKPTSDYCSMGAVDGPATGDAGPCVTGGRGSAADGGGGGRVPISPGHSF